MSICEKAEGWVFSFHFHRWSPWQQYLASGVDYGWVFKPREKGVEFSERRQRRHCVVCNKEQDYKIA